MKYSLLAASMLPAFAIAQTSPATDSHTETETMVVTASRMPQAVGSVLAPITVITAEDIELTQAKSVADVLKLQPGVTVIQSGGRGTATSVYIRGANADQTLVLVDGVRVQSATMGQPSLALLPSSMIEQIELIRGPRAVQWGADAIGGVINIITKPEAGEERNRLTAGVGNDDYAQVGYRAVKQITEQTRLQTNLNAERSDGYDIKPDDGVSNDYGFEAYNIVLGAESQFSQAWSGELKGILNKGENDFYYYGLTTNEQEQQLIAATVAYQDQGFDSVMNVSYSLDETITDAYYYPVYQTKRTAVNWLNSWSLPSIGSANLGIDGRHEDISGSSADYDEDSRNNIAIFGSLFLSQGALDTEISLRHDDNQRYGHNTTYSMNTGWHYLPNHQLKVGVATAFKAPSFNDLYFPFSGNSDLAPESSENKEIGLIGSWNFVEYELNIFNNQIVDMIAWAEADDGFWYPSNIDDATLTGVELVLDFETGPIAHQTSYTYLDAEDESTGNQLTYRSKDTVKWQLSYQQGDWDFTTALMWFSKRYTDDTNTSTLDDYSLVNLAVGYQVSSQLALRAAVNNLFDTDYEMNSSYAAQGVNGTFTAIYDF